MSNPAISKKPGIIDLDELQTEAERLLSLLKDRQHGLISWNLYLKERIENIHRISSVVVGDKKKESRPQEAVKVDIVEYRWTEDVSMDPYNRSGDENRCRGGILIPGKNCPTILVLMHDGIPNFHEMTAEDSGESLWREFGIDCFEWDFARIGEIQIDEALIRDARVMAQHRELAGETNSAFRLIFSKLGEEDD